MNQCPNCQAMLNPKWAECLSCGCPVGESHYAQNERTAIQAEGGPSLPVEMVLENSILGATVPVELWPDRALVDGVSYSNEEMTDLIDRGLSAERLREIHMVKQSFEGKALTIEQAKALGGDRNERGNKEQT
jgi:hypothetical protein